MKKKKEIREIWALEKKRINNCGKLGRKERKEGKYVMRRTVIKENERSGENYEEEGKGCGALEKSGKRMR